MSETDDCFSPSVECIVLSSTMNARQQVVNHLAGHLLRISLLDCISLWWILQ